MTLFAALAAASSSAATSTTSSCSPPEAVQLHCVPSRLVDFLGGGFDGGDADDGAAAPATDAETAEGGADANNTSAAKGGAENDDDVSRSRRRRRFSALSYQAARSAAEERTVGGSRRAAAPDLGIWDCRVDGESSSAAALLQKVVLRRGAGAGAGGNRGSGAENKDSKEGLAGDAIAGSGEGAAGASPSFPAFILAVDLTEDPSRVGPAVEVMRRVVVEACGEDADDGNNNRSGGTTSLTTLESHPFGKAPVGDGVEDVSNGSSSAKGSVSLILACLVPPVSLKSKPSSSPAETYRIRQARALVLYHLHKFASEVDCTLCFVRENGGGANNGGDADEDDVLLGRHSTVSVDEFAGIVRRVALGLAPVEEENKVVVEKKEEGSSGGEDDKEGGAEHGTPAVLAPGTHDGELINGAYLRNASCEGHWDAGTNGLVEALPPPIKLPSGIGRLPTDKGEADGNETNGTGAGDGAWLSKMASSIGTPTGVVVGDEGAPGAGDAADGKDKKGVADGGVTPKKKKPVKSKPKKGEKKKGEKDVSSFFENLLQK